jgi:hypothetical protein
MGRLYSSWIGRAVLATALVTTLIVAGTAEPGPLGALLLSMVVVTGAVALRKRRVA